MFPDNGSVVQTEEYLIVYQVRKGSNPFTAAVNRNEGNDLMKVSV